MADVQFAQRDPYSPLTASGQLQRLGSLAGAALSVALVLGLCLWGYRLAVRDVTGVPVVRAMEGPMRVAPDNPGGEVMAHQGLAVNQVAADGAAGGPAERLVLAPRAMDLTDEDAAGSLAAPAAPTSARSDTMAGLTIAASAAEPPPDTATAIEAVLTDVLQDEGAVTDAVAVSGTLDADPAAEVIAASMPGRVAGPTVRPMPRPARLSAAPAAPGEAVDAAPVIPASLPEIDPSTLAAGTRLVQLGAFDTVEAARAEWDKLYLRFGDLMRDKARVVEPAQSGGRTFYRLRAHGFGDETDARRFCSALLAEEAACIPVAQR